MTQRIFTPVKFCLNTLLFASGLVLCTLAGAQSSPNSETDNTASNTAKDTANSATNNNRSNSGVIVLSDTVTGNQEQPKVLYIVPWQGAGDDTMLKQELITRLQSDVFAPVERAEHQRELEMINALSSPDTD